MDFMKALTFPFDDDDWLPKAAILIGVMFGLILTSPLIIPYFVLFFGIYGYLYEIMKRVRSDHPEPFPSLGDYREYLSNGFKIVLGLFATLVPVYLVMFVIFGVGFITSIISGVAAVGAPEEAQAFAAFGAIGIFVVIYVVFYCFVLLYVIAASINLAGGLLRFMDREQINTFFQIGENIAILRDNLRLVGTALLYLIGGQLIFGLVAATVIGAFLLPPFALAFQGHVTGQLRKAIDEAQGPVVAEPAPSV